MEKKRILKWEIIGFIVITLMGTAFHFCFEWSGNLKPLALFCAVNESVWEHTKMGFWPAVFYSIVEYFAYGRNKRNFLFAKTLALYILPIVIITVFYAIEAIIGHHVLWADIALFIASILISQYFSYRIITSSKDYSRYNKFAAILLIVILTAFSLFTYFPPKLELFKDSNTGSFGIP